MHSNSVLMRCPGLVASPLTWVAGLFAALLIGMPQLRPVFHWAFPEVSPPVFARDSFVDLFLSHAGLVALASLAATLLGIGLAIFVTRPFGRDFRPIVNALAKVPLFKGWMQKASRVALEKQNPELASAIAKLERAGVARDPQRAQAALSRLTAGERRAYLEAAGAQGQLPTPSNRQERRRMEKLQKKSQGR